jgi:hypothetical protein
MATETRWVIVNDDCGLYTGQWLTRKDAIAEHVSMVRMGDDPEVSRTAWKLTTAHLEIWRRCKRQGDRAVKATVIY